MKILKTWVLYLFNLRNLTTYQEAGLDLFYQSAF